MGVGTPGGRVTGTMAEVACHRIRVWAASGKYWGLEVIRGQGVSRAGSPPPPTPRPGPA